MENSPNRAHGQNLLTSKTAERILHPDASLSSVQFQTGSQYIHDHQDYGNASTQSRVQFHLPQIKPKKSEKNRFILKPET